MDLPPPIEERSIRLRWLAAAIVLTVTAFRIAYLLYWCPYDLAPDEGHYWDWSRHLDWSYYSKGPLIAWIIRGGCELFGSLSLSVNGTLMPAVRIPAVFCGSALLIAIYVLTFQTFRSDRLAFAVLLGALSYPAFAVCSVVMTIDAPFLCCWGWALVLGRWAFVDGKRWAWPALGLLVAIGILAKYTMALWLFSAGLFVLFTPTHRQLLFRSGFWIMAIVAGLSAIPILIWNSQHDWVTFRHVAVQSGVAEGKQSKGIRWGGPFEYAALQCLLLLGFWFVVWAAALWHYRPRQGVPAGIRYLWWMSLPTFALFGASSLRASGQLNWPVAAYLSGAVLAGGLLREVLHSRRRFLRRLTWASLGLFVALGSVLSILMHDTRLVTTVVAPSVKEDSPADPMPIRKYDPAARLKGSRYLASELDKMRISIQATDGHDPVIAGFRWDQPGLIGFYCDGHPQVYTIALVLRQDRHSQYDLWHPNPVDNAQAFIGKTFLIVGGGDPRAALGPAFESVGGLQEVVYRENGRAVARWLVCECRGFKGFDPALFPRAATGH
jgi:hypothetical protein